MLKRFGFRREMYYLCPSEEEKALNTGVFSSFFAEKGQKNHCFTKHLGNFICRRKIFTCFCGFFSGQVGAQIDDVATRKVKRYLFSNLYFFRFGELLRWVVYPKNGSSGCSLLVGHCRLCAPLGHSRPYVIWKELGVKSYTFVLIERNDS